MNGAKKINEGLMKTLIGFGVAAYLKRMFVDA